MDRINRIGRNGIEIYGTIRDMNEITQIKDQIEALKLGEGEILNISIRGSFAMPSALIGYLLKLVEQQKIDLSLTVDDEMLAELLEDLNLQKVFNLRYRPSTIPA
ncbi:MAG: hypothetical protein B6D59_02695 [Campylobacteraceae bacterium 4484_4]|nr:MAG: hypothetical protein B6D59_02695 [Campylobacteraceae bacterium 4484_4]